MKICVIQLFKHLKCKISFVIFNTFDIIFKIAFKIQSINDESTINLTKNDFSLQFMLS